METLARYGCGGVLADDLSLGKTLQSIAFILSELPHIHEKKRAACEEESNGQQDSI